MRLWQTSVPELLEADTSQPKYLRLAKAIEAAIDTGQLRHSEQLPTVRDLADKLGISGTTVAAAYRTLAEQKLISGKVGSGTRVIGNAKPNPSLANTAEGYPVKRSLWRRRTQTNHIATLSRAFPNARNYASGTPNPALLPLAVLKSAWKQAAQNVSAADLQYAGPTPIPELARVLLTRLERDLVLAEAADLVIGSSAQQFMTLALQIAVTLAQEPQLLVGVEEPGYPTLFDSCERLGHRLVGIEVDTEGAVPASVERALDKGAKAIILTPRAHNPTGVSWTSSRLAALTELFTAYPDVLIVEDDQFADATNSRVGTLLNDPRLENRVIYVRSFSKVIAPDLRLAVAVARPQLRSHLIEGKFYSDGWSSCFAQRALVYAFADEALDEAINFARETYNCRRESLVQTLTSNMREGELKLPKAVDGVNVWLELQNGVSSSDVAEQLAAAGILVATSEPFHVRVGHDNALRINVGSLETGIPAIGTTILTALREVVHTTPARFSRYSL